MLGLGSYCQGQILGLGPYCQGQILGLGPCIDVHSHMLRGTLRLWRVAFVMHCGTHYDCGWRVVYCHIVMHSGTRCLCGALFIFILRVTCELWRPRYLYICIVKCRIVGLSGRFVVVSTPLLLGIVK